MLESEEEIKGILRNDFYMQLSDKSDPNYLIPTSATWVHSHPAQIVSGHANSNSLFIFDIGTVRIIRIQIDRSVNWMILNVINCFYQLEGGKIDYIIFNERTKQNKCIKPTNKNKFCRKHY